MKTYLKLFVVVVVCFAISLQPLTAAAAKKKAKSPVVKKGKVSGKPSKKETRGRKKAAVKTALKKGEKKVSQIKKETLGSKLSKKSFGLKVPNNLQKNNPKTLPAASPNNVLIKPVHTNNPTLALPALAPSSALATSPKKPISPDEEEIVEESPAKEELDKDDTESDEGEGCDTGKICTELDVLKKQQQAFKRSSNPYFRNFSDISRSDALVKIKPGSIKGIRFSAAVMSEKFCKTRTIWVTRKGKKKKKAKLGRVKKQVKICWSVPRERNFTTPFGKEILEELAEEILPINNGNSIQINSLTRDHNKQYALKLAGYPVARYVDGVFLSGHLKGNAADMTGLNEESKKFIYNRFVGPWVEWDPYYRPVIVYFEGRDQYKPYYERSGAVHIEWPIDKVQLGVAKDLLDASDEELSEVIQKVQKKLKKHISEEQKETKSAKN